MSFPIPFNQQYTPLVAAVLSLLYISLIIEYEVSNIESLTFHQLNLPANQSKFPEE